MKKSLLFLMTGIFCFYEPTGSVLANDDPAYRIAQNSKQQIRHYERKTQLSIEVPAHWQRYQPEDKTTVMIFKDAASGTFLQIEELVYQGKRVSLGEWVKAVAKEYKAEKILTFEAFFRPWFYFRTVVKDEQGQQFHALVALTEQFNTHYMFYFQGEQIELAEVQKILESISFFHPAPDAEPELTVLPTPTPLPTPEPEDIWEQAFTYARQGDFETGIQLLKTIPADNELNPKAQVKIQEWQKILLERQGKALFEKAMGLAVKGDFAQAIEQVQQVPQGSSFYAKAQTKLKEWNQILLEREAKSLYDKAFQEAGAGNFAAAISLISTVSKSSSYYAKAQQKKLQWQKILAEREAKTDFRKLQIKTVGVPQDLAAVFQKYQYELVYLLKTRPDALEGLSLPATLVIDFSGDEALFTLWAQSDRKAFKLDQDQGYTFVSHFGINWLVGMTQIWYQGVVSQLYTGSDAEKALCRKYCAQLDSVNRTWYSAGVYTGKDTYFRQFARAGQRDPSFAPQAEIKLTGQKPVMVEGRKLMNTGRKSFVFVLPAAQGNGLSAYKFFGLR